MANESENNEIMKWRHEIIISNSNKKPISKANNKKANGENNEMAIEAVMAWQWHNQKQYQRINAAAKIAKKKASSKWRRVSEKWRNGVAYGAEMASGRKLASKNRGGMANKRRKIKMAYQQ